MKIRREISISISFPIWCTLIRLLEGKEKIEQLTIAVLLISQMVCKDNRPTYHSCNVNQLVSVHRLDTATKPSCDFRATLGSESPFYSPLYKFITITMMACLDEKIAQNFDNTSF